MTDIARFKLVVSLGGFLVLLLQGCYSDQGTTTELIIGPVCNEGMKPCPDSDACRADLTNCPTVPSTTPEPTTSPDVTLTEINLTLKADDNESQSAIGITGSTQYDQSTSNNDMTSPSYDATTDTSNNVTDSMMTSEVSSEAETTSQPTSDTITTGPMVGGDTTSGDETTSTSLATNDLSSTSSYHHDDELSSHSVHTSSSPPSSPSQTTDVLINNTVQVSDSFVLVFKGSIKSRDKFESRLTEEVLNKLEEFYNKTNQNTGDHSRKLEVLKVNSTGENNQTVLTEAKVMSGVSVLSPDVMLSALKMKSPKPFFSSESSNLKFVCAYLSGDEPCINNIHDGNDVTDTKYGLYEYNRNLFIAIFVTVTLFLILILAVLISIRCRQRRRATYVTNVTLEKANLTLRDETMGIDNPLTDKEILKGEIENKNGAPPILPEDGWVVPLDEMPDRKNSVTEDTKL